MSLVFFIGPVSDHCLALTVTNFCQDSTDVTLDRVDHSLVEILKLKSGRDSEAEYLSRF